MKNGDPEYVIIGKIGSTYGVRGWLKIQSFTESPADILSYSPWYLSSHDNKWTLIALEDSRLQGNKIVAKIKGFETPEEASALTGKTIAILRSQLPLLKKDEYYHSDLIGLSVINQNNEVLGKVTRILETGANDVLIIKGAKEHAIPYLPRKVILSVNLETQEIHVDWED